jgi:hypothetical protein
MGNDHHAFILVYIGLQLTENTTVWWGVQFCESADLFIIIYIRSARHPDTKMLIHQFPTKFDGGNSLRGFYYINRIQ